MFKKLIARWRFSTFYKKMKTMFILNMSKSPRLTSTFFLIMKLTNVSALLILATLNACEDATGDCMGKSLELLFRG